MNDGRGSKFETALHQRGFSLVEIMVALVLSLFLVAGVIQLFLGTRQTYRFHEALSRIQENGRFATEILSRDIRMTGFTGCPPTNPVVNVLNNPADWWKDFGAGALVGYDGAQVFPGRAVGTNAGDRVAGTDAAIFLGGSGGYFITASAPTALPPTFTLSGLSKPDGSTLSRGDIAIVCDVQRTSIFQVTTVTAGPPSVIAHASGAGTAVPGNCTANLFPSGTPPAPCASGGTVDAYVPAQSTLVDFSPSAYYVGVGASGAGRSLYRLQLQVAAAAAPPTASMVSQELIEGVQDMQIFYGEDTNGDRIVDQYVDANAVADWANVLSVRVNLLLVSLENNLANAAQTILFPADTGGAGTVGNSFAAGDRRIYQTFTTTIGIRNRLP